MFIPRIGNAYWGFQVRSSVSVVLHSGKVMTSWGYTGSWNSSHWDSTTEQPTADLTHVQYIYRCTHNVQSCKTLWSVSCFGTFYDLGLLIFWHVWRWHGTWCKGETRDGVVDLKESTSCMIVLRGCFDTDSYLAGQTCNSAVYMYIYIIYAVWIQMFPELLWKGFEEQIR